MIRTSHMSLVFSLTQVPISALSALPQDVVVCPSDRAGETTEEPE